MYDKVIKNGTLVTAAATFEADVALAGERIAVVGLNLAGEETIDAAGCLVIPGGVDAHVHLQMPVGNYTSSDDFESGTIAAAHGGTTTIIDFVEPDEGEPMPVALAARQGEADGRVAIDYGLHMTIPAWQADHALDEIAAVMEAGVYSFKLYQAYGALLLDDARLYRVLAALGRHGALPILHSENGPVLDELRAEALAAGHVAPIWHARTRPATMEAEAVGRALALARQANAPPSIVHVSCVESLHEIQTARVRGQTVYGEACPHYLWLGEELLEGPHAERFICAPPLRGARHRRALLEALARGDLQTLSTDHCPFTASEKAAEPDFTLIPGGLPTVESRVSLAHDAAQSGAMSLSRWVDVCSTSSARLFRLPHKGHIAPNFDADLVVFEPQRAVTLGAEWLHERVDWSPFEGRPVKGWPRHVFSRGTMIVRDGSFVGRAGHGRFLRAG